MVSLPLTASEVFCSQSEQFFRLMLNLWQMGLPANVKDQCVVSKTCVPISDSVIQFYIMIGIV